MDDFTGVESESTAQSAFEGFLRLNDLHGVRSKPKKEQPPAKWQRNQGVGLKLEAEKVAVEPLLERRKRIVT